MKLVCWDCELTEEALLPGWALRADELVASCPDHLRYMPPHPQGLKYEYVELGSPRALTLLREAGYE